MYVKQPILKQVQNFIDFKIYLSTKTINIFNLINVITFFFLKKKPNFTYPMFFWFVNYFSIFISHVFLVYLDQLRSFVKVLSYSYCLKSRLTKKKKKALQNQWLPQSVQNIKHLWNVIVYKNIHVLYVYIYSYIHVCVYSYKFFEPTYVFTIEYRIMHLTNLLALFKYIVTSISSFC